MATLLRRQPEHHRTIWYSGAFTGGMAHHLRLAMVTLGVDAAHAAEPAKATMAQALRILERVRIFASFC
jgi:hypothetical protein